uniref:Uncharacterized protein n=1 Tax=Plectus sambesii TaxID=2011161 RepID=A0A914XJS8_9BILA
MGRVTTDAIVCAWAGKSVVIGGERRRAIVAGQRLTMSAEGGRTAPARQTFLCGRTANTRRSLELVRRRVFRAPFAVDSRRRRGQKSRANSAPASRHPPSIPSPIPGRRRSARRTGQWDKAAANVPLVVQ